MGRRFAPRVMLPAAALALACTLGRAASVGAQAPAVYVGGSVATTTSFDDGARKAWDVVFWRPFYIIQLVGGVAALPVALPLSAMIGDWRDGVAMCVTDPARMAFDRPLGQ